MLLLILGRAEGKEKYQWQRTIHQLPPARPLWRSRLQLAMYPSQESNQRPLHTWEDTQATEHTGQDWGGCFYVIWFLCHWLCSWCNLVFKTVEDITNLPSFNKFFLLCGSLWAMQWWRRHACTYLHGTAWWMGLAVPQTCSCSSIGKNYDECAGRNTGMRMLTLQKFTLRHFTFTWDLC